MEEDGRLGDGLREKSVYVINMRDGCSRAFPAFPSSRFPFEKGRFTYSFGRTRRKPLLWNLLVHHLSLAGTLSVAPQPAVHHQDKVARVSIKHLDPGKNASSVVAPLVTWSLDFGVT